VLFPIYHKSQVRGRASHLFFPLYALLVLGWDENDERACIAASKKGQTVLPLVANVAGSALTNTLLAERIYELEAAADQKALREMELFKKEMELSQPALHHESCRAPSGHVLITPRKHPIEPIHYSVTQL